MGFGRAESFSRKNYIRNFDLVAAIGIISRPQKSILIIPTPITDFGAFEDAIAKLTCWRIEFQTLKACQWLKSYTE